MGIDVHDPPAARALRAKLYADIAARQSLGPRVRAALDAVPRHLFVDGPLERAYRDIPLPIGWDQTISQPTIVALMSDALELTGAERVLEIGTGSGYQAAVLSRLAARVYTIEFVPALAALATGRLASLGCSNVEVRHGDGYAGWAEQAPFDRIVLTAAPPSIPDALRDQLAANGLLVAPVGEGSNQHLVLWRKAEGTTTDLGPVRFVPMVR
jgi:protein-L-isoaspartate(D-aspartate) O-methyltransferase